MPIRIAVGFLMAALSLSPPAALGQRPAELAFADPQPHFVAAWAPKKPREAERSAVLVRRLSLELADVTLDSALKELTAQAGLNITYSPAVLPAGKRVTIKATDVAVVTALTEILFRSGLDVMVDRDGALALVVCRHPAPRAEIPDSGTIVGTVTDKATGAPIGGATLAVEGTTRTATTGSDGRYRIDAVPAGRHKVRVRYIGYAPLEGSIEVPGGGEVTADFVLVKSLQKLDELVTTGTVVPTEVRALPVPISVINSVDLELRNVVRMDQVFRQLVPSAVAWNLAVDVEQTATSVRGATSLGGGGGSMKVYLDGIEISDRSTAAIDPNSIERIEVIRGPQAAAVYGSGAIGGVMQVFTKRGDGDRTRPQFTAQADVGVIESPYEGSSGALRQTYRASIRGGSSTADYSIGGGYTRQGDWVIEGGTTLPSVFGGVRYSQGQFTIDLSGRYYAQSTNTVVDPRLASTGFSFFSKPFHWDTQYRELTYGARLSYVASRNWSHSLTVGVDRFGQDIHSTEPRLTTPADTFLFVQQRSRSKASIVYSTSLSTQLSSGVTITATTGADYYSLWSDGYFTFGARNTSGAIQSAFPIAANRDVATNRGYLAQVQLNISDAFFLTGGLRAERNSGFGSNLKTSVSPRVGASHVRELGFATMKLRASYGEAIQPPDPGQREAVAGVTTQLANPQLGPARQAGWDAGFDLAFGTHGSFSGTYFNQSARDLIQFVRLAGTEQVSQYQNVGRVRNMGIEVEGTFDFRRGMVKAQYAYTRSRVDQLGLLYNGDLHPGDQSLQVPKHTGGVALSFSPIAQTTFTVGFTYVGRWTNYDNMAQFGCFGGTAPCRSSNRDYIAEYPGAIKANASLVHSITSAISAIISVENFTNDDTHELSDIVPVIGRVITAGVRIQN